MGRSDNHSTAAAVEIWGGFECTIARIGGQWRNQLIETGHAHRIEDLDVAASLGISRFRYPVLWEMVAPDHPDRSDWRWCDERLDRIRALGLSVIAGLVHHGSGPGYTNLLDSEFPQLLARHALAAARRYPWIEDFTPINEPLTTARFSGLYGHWYPHGTSEAAFLRALFNQCRGIAMSMAAIRQTTPRARLIQTEDLGRVFSTPHLAYQADYENERRWLSFDLLVGRVDRRHSWFDRFIRSGVSELELLEFVDNPCPPHVIGINHYLTSDRYLDEDIAGYPEAHIGGNGLDRYADVAAVRAHLDEKELGFEARLSEASARYCLPVAITEVHNGSSREEQLRWLMQAWDAVVRLRAREVDVRAFTPWALVGAMDWTSLLTRCDGIYEPGVFDARAEPPRPTKLADAIRSLATSGTYQHPVTSCPGWWQRPGRFHRQPATPALIRTTSAQPILITGLTGTLGRAFARLCDERGLSNHLLSRNDMDIASPQSVRDALDRSRPWAIVNAAGFVRVADAEREQTRCMRENTVGPGILAEISAQRGLPFVTFSSDLVFDGLAGRAYVESDPTCPACVYGVSKAEAERLVMRGYNDAMVVRTSAFFGPWDRYNFIFAVLSALQRGEPFIADGRAIVSPTHVPDLVSTVLDLLIDGATGLWHVASDGRFSWYEFAKLVAKAAALDASLIQHKASAELRVTVLRSERGIKLPCAATAIEKCTRQLAAL